MAQLVARLVRNEKAGGSNPPSSTIRTLILIQSERPIFMLRGGAVWLVSAGFWILLACLYASAGVAEVMRLRLISASGCVPGSSR